MSKKISTPESVIIETTALEMAAVWYEIGKSQGLTSKHTSARDYARANLNKFIPKAIEHLLSMLGRNDIPKDQKDMIYTALIERHNDPELCAVLPNIDVKKALELSDQMEKRKVINIKGLN